MFSPWGGDLGFLVMRSRRLDLVSVGAVLFKGSTTTTASRCWPLGARACRLPDCHQQGQTDSCRGASTACFDSNSGRSVVKRLQCNFLIILEVLCISNEFL